MGMLTAGLLLALSGCSQSVQASTEESPSPSPPPGPAPGPECVKIWIEDIELPEHGFDYDGCYQVVDGKWKHEATYTDCYDENPDDLFSPSRLWEYVHPETGVRLYAFADARTAWIENGDVIGALSGGPAIDTARSVCTEEY